MFGRDWELLFIFVSSIMFVAQKKTNAPLFCFANEETFFTEGTQNTQRATVNVGCNYRNSMN